MFSSLYSTTCLMIALNSPLQIYYSLKAGLMYVKKCVGSRWKATIASWDSTPKPGKKSPSYERKTASYSRLLNVSQPCESLLEITWRLCTETSKVHTQDANDRRWEINMAIIWTWDVNLAQSPFSLQLGAWKRSTEECREENLRSWQTQQSFWNFYLGYSSS